MKNKLVPKVDLSLQIEGIRHSISEIKEYINQERQKLEIWDVYREHCSVDLCYIMLEEYIMNLEKNIINFKNFRKVNESPLKQKLSDKFFNSLNKEYESQKLNDYIKIDTITVDNLILNIFEKKMGKLREWIFVNNDKNIALYRFVDNNDKILEKLIWQNKEYKNIMFNIYFEYILNKFDFIVSDNKMSKYGEIFTRKILNKLLKISNYNIGIWSFERNEKSYIIKDEEELNHAFDNYMSNVLNGLKSGFYIEKVRG